MVLDVGFALDGLVADLLRAVLVALPRPVAATGPSKVLSVVVTDDKIEKLAEGHAGFQVVTEVGSADHLIPIAASYLLLAQVPLPHQVAHDLLHRSLGDPDRFRDISHPGLGVQGQ